MAAAAPADNTFEFLQKLEDFFSSPEFTSSIGTFLGENAPKLEFKPLEEEQPMQNHDIYQKYCQLVEKQLEAFMSREGLTQQRVFEACQKASSAGEASWLTCIDYLLASTEYESFMQLAYDHQCMTVEAGELTDDEVWDAPPDDGADGAGAGAGPAAGAPADGAKAS